MSQETPIIYPVSQTNLPEPSHSHHHSNGSFGAVFIVLAVIVVISAIACFLGRLCNKRYAKSEKKPEKNHAFRPPKLEREPKHISHAFQPKERDIEFGFDRPRMPPTAKVAANGGEAAMGMGRNSSRKGGEVRFADHHEGDFKAGGTGQQY